MNLRKWERFKWDPIKELDEMSQRLNRLFGRLVILNRQGRILCGVRAVMPSHLIDRAMGRGYIGIYAKRVFEIPFPRTDPSRTVPQA